MTQFDAQSGQPERATSPDETVVRHEERLEVSTTRRPTGRVRIGKRVVTETVQVPVQVRREVLVYEQLPAESTALDHGAAPIRSEVPAPPRAPFGSSPAPGSRRERRAAAEADARRDALPAGEPGSVTQTELPQGPTEVVLHEERPVVSLQTVQVERVRLVPARVGAEHTVTEPVRREHVELESSAGATGGTGR